MAKSSSVTWEPILIPAAILFAVALRLWGVGSRPIDGDEGLIFKIALGSVNHVLAGVAVDVHPPLFHLLTSVVLAVGGASALTLRLVSIIAGIGVVALGPSLARRFKVSPSLVTWLLATSPFLVYVSQDARMYSLLAFLTLASWIVLLKAWDEPKEWRQWFLWGLLTAMMLLTHHLGWIVFVGELVATLVFARKVLKQSWQWVGGLFLVIAAYGPVLPLTLAQIHGRLAEQATSASVMERITSFIGWLYRSLAGRTFLSLSPHALVDQAKHQPGMFLLFLFSFVVPIALVGFGKWQLYKHDRRTLRIWGVLTGIPLLTVAAVGSVAIQAPRYLAFLAPIILTFLAIGLQAAWRWRSPVPESVLGRLESGWGKVVAVVLVGTILAGLWTQLMIHDRALGVSAYARAIRSQQEAGDVVLVRGAFAGGDQQALEYELTSCDADPNCRVPMSAAFVFPFAVPIVDMYGDYSVGNLAALRAVTPASQVDQLLITNARVWFYDQTYAANPLAGLENGDQVIVQQLGFDKERQPLTLYLITK